MNPVTYLKETVSELKLVHWPSRDETIRLTGIVLAVSIFVGVYVGGLDFIFTNLLTVLFK